MSAEAPDPTRPSRRRFLATGAVGVAGAVAGLAGGYALGTAAGAGGEAAERDAATPAATASGAAAELVDPHGAHQAGIARPQLLQRQLQLAVLDLDDVPIAELAARLDACGKTIADLCAGEHPGLGGLAPARLTVTIGVGGRIVSTAFGGALGWTDLPAFSRDDIPDDRRDGDVLVLCRSDDGAVAALARDAVIAGLGGRARWTASGFTSAADGPATRNLVGFHDGISLPQAAAELDESVWLADGAASGGSIAVVRVMPIDTAAFTALDLHAQEAAVGRTRSTGAPLSGGAASDDPDLNAKSAAGVFDIPVDAHVRRAHPLPTGLDGLMMRRSYAYSNGPDDQGAIFVSFQRSAGYFIRTQQRLDESDALLAHTRTTASGAFLILPGFTAEHGLGRALLP
ncbi:Dyp-type peroxidase [Microbacterium sp. NPDC058389]|uniref:Dyp-type peroxidase n=1 Tax=Microbacterium sp. NPDC058389 TaxID=3346475 RepID=UPI00365E7446